MSGLVLTSKAGPATRLNMSAVNPSRLASMSTHDIANLPVGVTKSPVTVGDAFSLSGTFSGTLTISPRDAILDYAGAGMDSGCIIIDGNVGAYAGRKMNGGELIIRGDAGGFLASGASGGTITVSGSAGDSLGSILAGDRFGMTGGMVVVEGSIGARSGEKMRRGTVIVRGKAGPGAGSRMIGGTIWAEGGFGVDPGLMMRRGTLIGAGVERLLPTFVDCGRHDLLVVRILAKYLQETLGALAPKPLPLMVRKIAGDMATIGKGEILLPA